MRPLRAFPFPLNVGTDICRISRIHRILRSPRGARFVQRILAPEEQALATRLLSAPPVRSTTAHPAADDAAGASRDDEAAAAAQWQNDDPGELPQSDPELWNSAVFVAGRFAAKEAAMKAHSHRRLTFHDIIIERRGRDEDRLGSGPPIARIRGAEGAREDESAVISISHDGDYATAVCMGYDASVVRGR